MCDDKPALLRALRGLMRSGGRIATTFQPRLRGASAQDGAAFADRLMRRLGDAGYVDARVLTLPLAPVPAVGVIAAAP